MASCLFFGGVVLHPDASRGITFMEHRQREEKPGVCHGHSLLRCSHPSSAQILPGWWHCLPHTEHSVWSQHIWCSDPSPDWTVVIPILRCHIQAVGAEATLPPCLSFLYMAPLSLLGYRSLPSPGRVWCHCYTVSTSLARFLVLASKYTNIKKVPSQDALDFGMQILLS